MDIMKCLKTIEDLQNALNKEKQLRMVYENELREIRGKSFIELKNFSQQQNHLNGRDFVKNENYYYIFTIGHLNNETFSSQNLIKTNNTPTLEPATNNRILFEKSCSPTTLLEVISLDNVNTSNIIKLHHLQQQEKELFQNQNTHSIINLDSNSIINRKFNDGGILINSTHKTPTTPVILTNFGAINTLQQQQPTATLQPFHGNKQSTLFLQIDPTNSSNFTPLVQTNMQPPQQAFQNLSVYCATSEPLPPQQLHEKKLQAEQISLQAKMVEELRYLTSNVITANSTTTPTTTPSITMNRTESKILSNESDTNLSVSQRNLQAMLDAICHLEGTHSVVNATTPTSNDLMVR